MEENDKLKEFVAKNRSDFDFHAPPNINFSAVKKTTQQPKGNKPVRLVPLKSVLQIAAAILLVGCISGAIYLKSVEPNQVEIVATPKEEINSNLVLSSISEEMAETENYYIQQVNVKQRQIEELGFSEDIQEELTILEQEFNELKTEIGESVDNKIIIEKMILNYQHKLNLLEQVLQSINSIDATDIKTKNNEDKYTTYY